jgi:hypothetical protein
MTPYEVLKIHKNIPWNGFHPDKKYTLRYSLDQDKKPIIDTSFSGGDLITSYLNIYRFYAPIYTNNPNKPLDNKGLLDLRSTCQHPLIGIAQLKKSKSFKTKQRLRKMWYEASGGGGEDTREYFESVIRGCLGALKSKKDGIMWLNDHLRAYFYLSSNINHRDSHNIKSPVFHVIDTPPEFFKKSLEDNDFEENPLLNRDFTRSLVEKFGALRQEFYDDGDSSRVVH